MVSFHYTEKKALYVKPPNLKIDSCMNVFASGVLPLFCTGKQNNSCQKLNNPPELGLIFVFRCISEPATMWPVFWTAMRTYAPYVTFPVAFVVGAVGYHLEWFIRGTPNAPGEERGIAELREDRKLEELTGRDSTQVLSLKDKLEFTPRAVLERNRAVKS